MPKKTTRRKGLTSVQIKPQVAQMLNQFTQKGLSKSELINEALRQYLIDQELQSIRARLRPYAQAQGIYTDEDVERLLK